MTEEIIPNDGRIIDINSPTAKSIIEGVVPKPLRTWTIFKNTNDTLEGIESIAFAMWQVALDEIEKESDHIVFMSDATVNLIMSNKKRLEQENEKLKKEVKQIGSDFIKKGDYARALEQENKELKKQIESDKGLITVGGKQQYQYLQRIDELEQENKEEKKAYNECMHYLACMTEQRNKLKTALEEIRNYCNRIEQGSVIGTQDCLINSIKNITNEVLNA